MDEPQKEQRYAVRRDAFVWDFPGGGFHTALVEEVSWSGMQLQSKHSPQLGSQIAVDLKGMIVWGTVQHCRPLEDWFAAGIRIDHVDDRTFDGVLSHRNAAMVYLGGEEVLAKDLSRAIPALRKNAARRDGMREGTADKEAAAGQRDRKSSEDWLAPRNWMQQKGCGCSPAWKPKQAQENQP
jgi:hypothetical protein